MIHIPKSVNPAHWQENYLGVWAVMEDYFREQVSRMQQTDIQLHVHANADLVKAEIQSIKGGYSYDLDEDGIATLLLRGSTTKYYSSLGSGTSTLFMRRTVNALRKNDQVKAVLLVIDSPGGAVAGNADWADALAKLAAEKPLIAYIEDLGASAAYWAASMAREIYSNRTAIVGSIGTYGVVYDYSKMAEMEGVKAIVVRAGKYKGMLTPGTEITDEQIAKLESQVQQLNEFFLEAVGRGRKMDRAKVESIATGEIWIGEEAAKQGLTDGVKTLDEVRADIAASLRPATRSIKETRMSEKTPATLAEIKQACPGASAEFVLEQIERGASVEQAKDDWIAHQALQLEQAEKDKAKAEAEAKERAAAAERIRTSGVDPIPAEDADGKKSAGGASAADEYRAAIKEHVANGMKRHEAVARVCREQPELQEAYVAEHNAKHPSAMAQRRAMARGSI